MEERREGGRVRMTNAYTWGGRKGREGVREGGPFSGKRKIR